MLNHFDLVAELWAVIDLSPMYSLGDEYKASILYYFLK